MGSNSAIEWTDHTWNPWRGCTKVSQGCKYCYMFRQQKQYGRNPDEVTLAANATFNFPLSKKVQTGDKVFTCSWSDWFHEVADLWRSRAWDIIRERRDVTFQILTKRPENIAERLPQDWGAGWENVWLGVSVEDQATADARIPLLIQTPAALRFVSYEPALGPVDFHQHLHHIDVMGGHDYNPGLHWLICGGESGPKARPMHPDWARSVRDQCVAAGVPFFFKQWGEWMPLRDWQQSPSETSEATFEVMPADRVTVVSSRSIEDDRADPYMVQMARVGKKTAGALLDGRKHREFPARTEVEK